MTVGEDGADSGARDPPQGEAAPARSLQVSLLIRTLRPNLLTCEAADITTTETNTSVGTELKKTIILNLIVSDRSSDITAK
jgi:hypothetical protein